MGLLGILLIIVGIIISLVYGIIILIKAFQTSILWGLGSLFIPFVSLIFVVMHWEETKRPFLMGLISILMGLISIPLIFVGTLLMPSGEFSEVFYPALLAG